MAFSSTMQLADLDYIAPSQACILPQIKSSSRKTAANKAGGASSSLIGGDDLDSGVEEIVKITLADCLACSGCVTTAETLLVTQQSKEEIINMMQVVRTGRTIPVPAVGIKPEIPALPIVPKPQMPCVVVSVSEQSLASIANQMKVSVAEAGATVSGFCRSVMQAQLVIDTRWAQVAALEATEKEFLHRLSHEPTRLPMIVSSCPGWVCYCEKTHPKLLDKLSNVRSPQAIAGSYIKHMVPEWLKVRTSVPPTLPSESTATTVEEHNVDLKPVQVQFPLVYHVSVQPCFDKKLEAVRGDFATRQEGQEEGDEDEFQKETDCVLSTQELFVWMQETDSTLPWRGAWNSVPVSTERYSRNEEEASDVAALAMQGSGGYHSWVLQGLVEHCSGVAKEKEEGGTRASLTLSEIAYAQQRNNNHKVIDVLPLLKDKGCNPPPTAVSGKLEKSHKFCVAYGFQHIQNIVRGINRSMASAKDYRLIELMACPDGCLNGGGQVRTKNNAATLKSVGEAFQRRNNELMGSEGMDGLGIESKRTRYETAVERSQIGGEEAPLKIEEVSVDGVTLFSQCGLARWVERCTTHSSVGAEKKEQPAGSHTSEVGGVGSGNPAILLTQYHDRQAEMNDAPDAQLLHALKW